MKTLKNIINSANANKPSLPSVLVITVAVLSIFRAFAQSTPDTLDTPEAVLSFLENEINSRSDSISIVVGSANDDGSLNEDFSYNADAALPLASTMKIIVLAAYAQEVVEGDLNPQTEVSTSDWEAYYLPFTDANAHLTALNTMAIETDELGFAKVEQTVTLDDIAAAMITNSDNAATDYLIDLVGEEALQRVIDENSLSNQDLPRSLLGSFLTWQHEDITALTSQELGEKAKELSALYTEDSTWREAEIERLRGISSFGDYKPQAAAFATFTKGSAADYARIMSGVVTETFISSEVSRVMQEKLEWPMQIEGNDEYFETFGTKGGSLPGIVTDTLYFKPKSGEGEGENLIAVLFLKDLTEKQFNNLLESGAFETAMFGLTLNSDLLTPLLEAQQALE